GPGRVAASAQMSNIDEWLDAYTTGPAGTRSSPTTRTGVPAARSRSRDQSFVPQSYTPPGRRFTPTSAATITPLACSALEKKRTTANQAVRIIGRESDRTSGEP